MHKGVTAFSLRDRKKCGGGEEVVKTRPVMNELLMTLPKSFSPLVLESLAHLRGRGLALTLYAQQRTRSGGLGSALSYQRIEMKWNEIKHNPFIASFSEVSISIDGLRRRIIKQNKNNSYHLRRTFKFSSSRLRSAPPRVPPSRATVAREAVYIGSGQVINCRRWERFWG